MAITLEAIVPSGQSNDYVTWGAAAGGGRGDVGIAGSVGISVLDIDTIVESAPGSHLKSTGSLTLNAEALHQSANVGRRWWLLDERGLWARLWLLPTSMPRPQRLSWAMPMRLPPPVSLRAPRSIPPKSTCHCYLLAQDPTANSVAVAGGASSGNVGVAGAVGISDYTLVTQAGVGAGSQINKAVDIVGQASQSLTIRAEDFTNLTTFAGSLGVSFGSAGVGAGLDLNIISKNTRAAIGAGANVSTLSGITIVSTGTEDLDSISANAGGGNSVGVAGSAAVYVINTTTRAAIDSNSGSTTTVTSGNTLSMTATGNFAINTIAASVGFGGTAGVGAGNVTLTHTDVVQAFVGDNANVTVTGGSGLQINATSREDVVGVSAAGAALDLRRWPVLPQ